MAIGKAGAKNAALLAIRILALNDDALDRQLSAYIQAMADEVEARQAKLTTVA
jgi:phosphoribosylcarboxyaminoimidazole (NCAIR) mutase